jgi:hypothetical protein
MVSLQPRPKRWEGERAGGRSKGGGRLVGRGGRSGYKEGNGFGWQFRGWAKEPKQNSGDFPTPKRNRRVDSGSRVRGRAVARTHHPPGPRRPELRKPRQTAAPRARGRAPPPSPASHCPRAEPSGSPHRYLSRASALWTPGSLRLCAGGPGAQCLRPA